MARDLSDVKLRSVGPVTNRKRYGGRFADGSQFLAQETDRMGAFVPVTEAELARARQDPKFRQQLMADNLDRLLLLLQKLRASKTAPGKERERQLREGVDLAVQLSERLHALASAGSKAG